MNTYRQSWLSEPCPECRRVSRQLSPCAESTRLDVYGWQPDCRYNPVSQVGRSEVAGYRYGVQTGENNLLAKSAFLRHKRNEAVRWFIINMSVVAVLTLEWVTFSGMYDLLVFLWCFLSAGHHALNLLRIYLDALKLDLEALGFGQHLCSCEGYQVKDLIRYFQDTDPMFLRQYWSYFDYLMAYLRQCRTRRSERSVAHVGTESLFDSVALQLRTECFREERRSLDFQDAQFKFGEHLVKYNRKALGTEAELSGYWENYLQSTSKETVRSSRAKRTPQNLICGSSRALQWPHLPPNRSNNEVVVSPILSKLHYQLSSNPSTDSPTTSSQQDFENYMRLRHGKGRTELSRWIANLKLWLATKMKELVEQFDSANEALRRCGCAKVQVGTSNLIELQTTLESRQELRTFIPLLPFLSLTENQNYLLWRYRVLATSRCLKPYSWNSGGDIDGKWLSDIYPTDSDVVLHFFANYFDMRLPQIPHQAISRRPFTDNYVVYSQSEQTFPERLNLAIVRQRASPPHFNVAVGGQLRDVPSGDNNLLSALVYFIYCLKTYQSGKIGRISLGKFGLNVLWIVGDDT